jgi:hypothetical protein
LLDIDVQPGVCVVPTPDHPAVCGLLISPQPGVWESSIRFHKYPAENRSLAVADSRIEGYIWLEALGISEICPDSLIEDNKSKPPKAASDRAAASISDTETPFDAVIESVPVAVSEAEDLNVTSADTRSEAVDVSPIELLITTIGT